MADLAGVERPVISTWARRHPDFPKPVVGDHRHPLFDAREFADWLITTGRGTRKDIDGDLQSYTLTRLTAEFAPQPLVAHLTSLICLRHLNDDEPLDAGAEALSHLIRLGMHLDPANTMLQNEIASLSAEWLPAQVDDLIEASWGTTNAFERVMDLRERLGATDLTAVRLDSELVRLIALLTDAVTVADRDPEATAHIYDPYAGVGDLLITTAATLREDQPVHLTARCGDGYLARLTRRRLTVHDLHDGGFAVHSDQADHPGANIIVTQLPYRPAEERSAVESLKLLDDIAVQLHPGTVAVVVAPADTTGTFDPYSEAGRLRADLIPGVVKAVIRLPGGLVPYRPGYEVSVWVLGADHKSHRGEVLLADVTDRPLTHAVVDALITDIVTWSRPDYNPRAHAHIHAIRTPMKSLVSEARPLTPRHQLTELEFSHDVPERVARALDLERILQEARPDRPQLPSHVELVPSPSLPPVTTIHELTRGGRQRINLLSLRKGTRIHTEHVNAAKHPHSSSSAMVIGAPELTGRSAPGDRRIDRIALTANYPSAQLSQPGDVIITTAPEPAALIDHEGHSVVQYPARVLRITEHGSRRFTPRVLAALLTRTPRVQGAIRAVQRIEEIRLPLLSEEAVERLDRLLAELDNRRQAIHRERTALDELQQLATQGLTDGTLTLTENTIH
ncbi:hypothetical protein [Nocardia terpenica]|uniref:DNA methylase adenine-specific domain-containing protein n=1 Tax=Nocardia terpenica TaxID=455432 RepID=A0A6G9YZ37_9NOCA|nr:hypothetical protein [Nocardia terpenica]QIS18484.1 hypothetical protein F6W96_09500 [Nocardia terpenica]